MSVVDPAGTTAEPVPVMPSAVVPAQRETGPDAVVDHVRRHGTRCYWDVAECRWACTRD